jgi:hypothetical protein
MTAWRARKVYLLATEHYGERAEEACGNESIDDLYILLGIKKKDEWLDNEDDEHAQDAQQPSGNRGPTNKRNRTKSKDEPPLTTPAGLLGGSLSTSKGEPEPEFGTLGTLQIGPSGIIGQVEANACKSVSTVDRNRKLLVCRTWDARARSALARGIAVLLLPEIREGCQP